MKKHCPNCGYELEPGHLNIGLWCDECGYEEKPLESQSSEGPRRAGCSIAEKAFIQGAKWREFHSTGARMWQSDQELAAKQALKMKENGTLGKFLEDR